MIKKNTKKTVVFLFATILMMVFGCSEETIETSPPERKSDITFKPFSLNDLKSDKKISKLLESVTAIQHLKPNSKNKTAGNSIHDFYIDENHGFSIVSEGVETYTFPIYKESDNENIQNIVFSKNQTGDFDVIVYEYDLTAEELEDPLHQGVVAPIHQTVLSNRYINQCYVNVLMCNNNGAGGTGAAHTAGNNCTSPSHLYYNTVVMDCGTTSTGSGGISTTPIGGGGSSSTSNPCEKMKNLFNPTKANIKPALTALKNAITPTGTGEFAKTFRKNEVGAYGTTSSTPTNNNMISGPVGPTIYGEAHTHPLDTYPMFSWTDVHRLIEIAAYTSPENAADVVNMVVVQDDNGVSQVYAIVFENNPLSILTVEDLLNQPELNGCTTREKLDKFDLQMAKKFENDPNYERDFLRQFFGFNIALYKANSSLSNWSKLTISSMTGNVKTTPCN